MNKNIDNGDSSASLKVELERVIGSVESLEESSENTNSSTMQETVNKHITDLENLTRVVSSLGMFSGNDEIQEVETDSLRFLLLPALLGFLTEKLTSGSRLDILRREQVYFQDFLTRLWTLGVIKLADIEAGNQQQEMIAQSRNRQKKIERFKERRILQENLTTLRERAAKNGGDAVDDQTAREQYLTELKLWASKAEDSLETVRQEIEILGARSAVRESAEPTTSAGNGPQRNAVPSASKPFIIARNDIQKAVYGLGYPGIPTVTLEEFFEQKRREGQIQVVEQGDNRGPQSLDDEQIEREQKEEREDPELVLRQREYDEYKDDHRRGWGNVHNKG